MHRHTAAGQLKQVWAERPVIFALVSSIGVFGLLALSGDIAAMLGFGADPVWLRYLGASAAAVTAYQQASAWRADANYRAERAYEAAAALEETGAGAD